MTDANEQSQATASTDADTPTFTATQIEELFQVLGIPPMPGYTPAAITAVAVGVSPTGQTARFPIYLQAAGANVTERTERPAAAGIIQRWVRVRAFAWNAS